MQISPRGNCSKQAGSILIDGLVALLLLTLVWVSMVQVFFTLEKASKRTITSAMEAEQAHEQALKSTPSIRPHAIER